MTTLYLKYRPQTLEEIDIVQVRESLKRLVSSGKIPHALLFAGPKGTGKTSTARILAKIINCEKNTKKLGEPCNKCEQCVSISKGGNIDVIELDAASHRGIDDVRALRDAVALASARARKKVYIIDEAHMLTTEASNALLKTLEEPPEHVHFFLATTDPEKLIETVRSRATTIAFKRAETEEIVRALERVIKGEKIKAEDGVLTEIAKVSDGSFRDAVKILEQILSEGRPLKTSSVREFLFKAKAFDVDNLIKLIKEGKAQGAIEEIEEAVTKGIQPSDLSEVIVSRLREALLAKIGIAGLAPLDLLDKEETLSLIETFTKYTKEFSDSPIPQLGLEIAILEWLGGREKVGEVNTKTEKGAVEAAAKRLEEVEMESRTKEVPSGTGSVNEEVWRKILGEVKPRNTTIEALLRAARPLSYDGRTLTLGVFYKFHKERLEQGRERAILEDVVGGVMGNQVKVVCVLTEPPAKVEAKKEEAVLTEGEDKDIIKIAEEIFGN